MEIDRLNNRWMNLFNPICENAIVLEKGFRQLMEKYTEKHRYYHNMDHINSSLGHLDELSCSMENSYNIEVALWFHDVIYDPKKTDNEKMSAEYAKGFLVYCPGFSDHIEYKKINNDYQTPI